MSLIINRKVSRWFTMDWISSIKAQFQNLLHFLVEADTNLLSTSFQLIIFQICFT
jgi:hypothetical protein